MNDQEFAKDTMNKIKIMQAYKDQYGEDDINEYFKIFGTWHRRLFKRTYGSKTSQNYCDHLNDPFIHSNNIAESNRLVALGFYF